MCDARLVIFITEHYIGYFSQNPLLTTLFLNLSLSQFMVTLRLPFLKVLKVGLEPYSLLEQTFAKNKKKAYKENSHSETEYNLLDIVFSRNVISLLIRLFLNQV